MPVTSSWRKRVAGACAAALAVPLALSAGVASAAPTPVPTVTPAAAAFGATTNGAYVTGTPKVDGQTLNFSVYSPAMERPVPIQMLVPKGYNATTTTATYPELYQLDGLRADEKLLGTTDWTLRADTKDFFADKNVLVVQVIGGYASFFQNWNTQDPGILAESKLPKNPAGKLKWEDFLTKELPGVIGKTFHGNGSRAISGLSMGGFSAFSLVAQHPELYTAAASYSGYPSTQILGLPAFLRYVLSGAGATNPDNMWGSETSPQWTANNPITNIANLKGKSLYMSAGTGLNGPYDEPLGFFGLSASYIGAILEAVANYSSQNFAQVAAATPGVNVTTDLANPGVHDWPYWNAEYKRSWPQLAKAIGADTSVGFEVKGAIAVKWNLLGGAHSVLGNPSSNETPISIGDNVVGQFNTFQKAVGAIYFAPSTGAHEVHGAIRTKYVGLGGPTGKLGFPTSDETAITGGLQNTFQFGTIKFVGGAAVATDRNGTVLTP